MREPQLAKSADPPGPDREWWSTWSEVPRLIVTWANLRRSGTVAILVGTLLLLINQGPVLFGGHPGSALAFRAVLTYLIPFLVATYGFLSATRRPRPRGG